MLLPLLTVFDFSTIRANFIKPLKLNRIKLRTSDVGSGKKNPWSIFNKTLLAHDAVLKSTIDRLDEKYVIFIDGDTRVDGELEMLAGAMEEKGYDLASVKVLPS